MVRWLSAITAAVLLGSLALSACGGAGVRVVAKVQGSPITLPALNHWSLIKRSERQRSSTAGSTSALQLKQKALAFLITAEWLQQEAAAQGISVQASEVNASYEQLVNGPTGQHFGESLKARGMSRADELLVLRLGALSQKLRAKLAAGHKGLLDPRERQQISAFIAAYRQRWKQRTTCQPGYVIAECSNGPALPPSPAG
jgi:hypothetical protein